MASTHLDVQVKTFNGSICAEFVLGNKCSLEIVMLSLLNLFYSEISVKFIGSGTELRTKEHAQYAVQLKSPHNTLRNVNFLVQ